MMVNKIDIVLEPFVCSIAILCTARVENTFIHRQRGIELRCNMGAGLGLVARVVHPIFIVAFPSPFASPPPCVSLV